MVDKKNIRDAANLTDSEWAEILPHIDVDDQVVLVSEGFEHLIEYLDEVSVIKRFKHPGSSCFKAGDLRVWWIPQIPGKAFNVSVGSVAEGAKILKILADYDLFQFDEKIKPDYSNAGGLSIFEDGDWYDWYDEETGEDDPEVWLAERAAQDARSTIT